MSAPQTHIHRVRTGILRELDVVLADFTKVQRLEADEEDVAELTKSASYAVVLSFGPDKPSGEFGKGKRKPARAAWELSLTILSTAYSTPAAGNVDLDVGIFAIRAALLNLPERNIGDNVTGELHLRYLGGEPLVPQGERHAHGKMARRTRWAVDGEVKEPA